jgi:drug/metabolite transporter (DMT)-like permease
MSVFWWTVLTALIILATPTILGLYDGAAFFWGTNDATISRFSQETAWQYPQYQWSLCLLFGVLMGHIFSTEPEPPPVARWVSLIAFVAMPYTLIVVSVCLRVDGLRRLTADEPRTYSDIAGLIPLVFGWYVGSRLLHQSA